MSWTNILKKGAKIMAPKRKTKSPGAIYPRDENENQVADMLEQKSPKENKFLEAVKEHETPKKDKFDCYVSTLSYPLPPVSWEKKQFKLNKKKRNARNRYL